MERNYEDLDILNKEKEKNLKKRIDEMGILKLEKEKVFEDNSQLFSEIDKLKNHVFILNDQNKRVFYLYLFQIFYKFANLYWILIL